MLLTSYLGNRGFIFCLVLSFIFILVNRKHFDLKRFDEREKLLFYKTGNYTVISAFICTALFNMLSNSIVHVEIFICYPEEGQQKQGCQSAEMLAGKIKKCGRYKEENRINKKQQYTADYQEGIGFLAPASYPVKSNYTE